MEKRPESTLGKDAISVNGEKERLRKNSDKRNYNQSLEEVIDDATEYFTQIPGFGNMNSNNSYELFSFDGHGSFQINYVVFRSSDRIKESSEVWAEGIVMFTPDGPAKEFDEILYKTAEEHETEDLTITEDHDRFPYRLAKFSILPEEIDKIPERHEDVAKMAGDIHGAYIEEIISNLENVNIKGSLDRSIFDYRDSELSKSEKQYRNAANNYISAFPDLIEHGVNNGLSLSEELLQIRRHLE